MVTIAAFVSDPLEPTLPPVEPARLQTATVPKLAAALLPPSLKVAASYTIGIRETMAAMAAGWDGVVFRTTDGMLAEGLTQSLFVVARNRLVVPPLDVVLDSVTRRLVLDVGGPPRDPRRDPTRRVGRGGRRRRVVPVLDQRAGGGRSHGSTTVTSRLRGRSRRRCGPRSTACSPIPVTHWGAVGSLRLPSPVGAPSDQAFVAT